MKDEWYGDKRDLVKWSGIIHLCEDNKIKTVIQVAYYSKGVSPIPNIEFDGQCIPPDAAVLNHFRDISDIKRLVRSKKIHIRPIKDLFNRINRDAYHTRICHKISKTKETKIVFLDPDTGLEPKKSRCTRNHVKKGDIEKIWTSGCLKPDDILVLYQHARQREKREKHSITFGKIRKRLAAKDCLNVELERIKQWYANKIDARFFYVKRIDSDPSC
jgi:hypothetical protein